MVGTFFTAILFAASAFASPSAGDWLSAESEIAIAHIVKNISPADASPGAVVAAQSRVSPNYYYHWVRDAGLVMDMVVDRYRNSKSPQERYILLGKLEEYLVFSEGLQNVRTIGGLGEPKFNVDGSAYNEPWGRPQNDGPALRALSFIHWAQVLISENHGDFVRQRLYDGKAASRSVIKRDLEFVSHHWRDSSFDLWEEVEGDHFYTRMVQRRALVEGASLALTLGDAGAAAWYTGQAQEIEKDLLHFWDEKRGYITVTRNRLAGVDYKNSLLDTAVILALLHGSLGDNFLRFSDYRVQATLEALQRSFAQIYPINQRAGVPGIAIGRYPEDLYGGSDFENGNPWPLCTLAIAEAYFRVAAEAGRSERAQFWIEQGDAMVSRVKYHAHANGSLSEQMDRHSGFMKSAEDLTWNYASVLSTQAARIKAVQSLRIKKK